MPAAADLVVTFTTGSINGAIDCFQIEILPDGEFEGDHNFGVNITAASISPAGIAMDAAGLGQIIILDNGGKLLTLTHVYIIHIHCICTVSIFSFTSTPSLQMLRSH